MVSGFSIELSPSRILKKRGGMFILVSDTFANALICVVTTLGVRAFIDARRDRYILENKFNASATSFPEVHFQQPISNPVRVVEIVTVHNVPATYAAWFRSIVPHAGAAPVQTQHFTSSKAQSSQQYYVLRPDVTSAVGGRQ